MHKKIKYILLFLLLYILAVISPIYAQETNSQTILKVEPYQPVINETDLPPYPPLTIPVTITYENHTTKKTDAELLLQKQIENNIISTVKIPNFKNMQITQTINRISNAELLSETDFTADDTPKIDKIKITYEDNTSKTYTLKELQDKNILSYQPPIMLTDGENTFTVVLCNKIYTTTIFVKPSSKTASTLPLQGKDITWIGDSYTVMVDNVLKNILPDIDIYAQSSKHFAEDEINNPSGLNILQQLKNHNAIRKYLVFALGTNDGITSEQTFTNYLQNVIDTANNSKIIFVTPYIKDSDTTNVYNIEINAIRNIANKYDNVYVADWAAITQGNTFAYFADDNIHPTHNGIIEWLNCILNTLGYGNSGIVLENLQAENIEINDVVTEILQ